MAMDIASLTEYALFRSTLAGLRVLPFPAARNILQGLGKFTGSVWQYRRDVVLDQLQYIYGDADSRRLDSLTDLVYNHLSLTVAETFCGDLEDLLARTVVDPDWAPFEEALSRGRGAIAVTGHVGNFELGGALIAARYPLLDVVKSQRNGPFDRYLNGLRARRGIDTVPMERSGPAVLRQLRKGGLVSLLLDQDAGDQGVTIDFLGRPASTWPGAARISLRTGAPVVPLAMQRLADGGHRMRLGRVLYPEDHEDTPTGREKYLQKISKAVEVFIEEHPEQWFWVHRRWKSRRGSA